MNTVLAAWNRADTSEALAAMVACCGAQRWAEAMVAQRPMESIAELSTAADRIWATMSEADWMEAFTCHPRIGERNAAHASKKSVEWSREEQSSAGSAAERVLAELAANCVQHVR